MARESSRLRAADLREVYLLVGECLELGADPVVWRRHLLVRLNRLLGAAASVNIDSHLQHVGDGPAFQASHAVNVDDLGPADRTILDRCFREMPVTGNPLGVAVLGETLRHGVAAASTRQCVPLRAWHASTMFHDYLQPLNWDDMLIGCAAVDGGLRLINFSRPANDRPFIPRASAMVAQTLRELSVISELRLAPMSDGSVHSLPPRLRDVLTALADGDNESQIALRLGISRATVHEYVRRLFSRYGVTSRSQLLVRAARQLHAARIGAMHDGAYWLYDGARR